MQSMQLTRFLVFGYLVAVVALPSSAEEAVFHSGSANAGGQVVNCYSNAGAERFRKNIRMGADGAIYNVIPPPPRKVVKPKPLLGASSILSFQDSAYQKPPCRWLSYFTWDKEQRQWSPARVDLSEVIANEAREQGVDPLIVELIIKHESGFDNHAASPAGAQGLMQLMPTTSQGLGLRDPFDPAANVAAGTRYFADQYRRFGDLHLALAAYNSGPGNVDAYNGVPPFPETVNYVNTIACEYETLKRKAH